ncbi:MAG TPA: YtxH domain-containing protein [Candidatus Saccharimonadales bacterium]|nr:YtxH domain-containing protein [Candidatus Saccharimonadales bacterium]
MTHHMPHKAETGSAATLAFLAGAAAGIAAGLLFAPRKGDETRAQLKDKAQQARMKAMDKMNEQKDAAKQQASEISDRAQDIVDESKDSVKEAQERVRKAAKKDPQE